MPLEAQALLLQCKSNFSTKDPRKNFAISWFGKNYQNYIQKLQKIKH